MKHSVARIAQQSRRVAGKAGEGGGAEESEAGFASCPLCRPDTRQRNGARRSKRDGEGARVSERGCGRAMGLIPGNAIARLKWRSPVYFDVQRSSLPSLCWVFISVWVKIDPRLLRPSSTCVRSSMKIDNSFRVTTKEVKWLCENFEEKKKKNFVSLY